MIKIQFSIKNSNTIYNLQNQGLHKFNHNNNDSRKLFIMNKLN